MGDKRPSVIHFVASGGLYGIERAILAILPALEPLGWNTVLVCFVDRKGGGQQVGRAFQAMGGEVHFVRVGGPEYPAGMLRVLRLLRSRRAAIVHVHGYKASILAGGAALLRGHRVVATYHGEARKSTELSWQVTVEGYVIPWFHHVMAVSEPIRDELQGRGVRKDRITVVNNAVADPGYRWFSRPGSGRLVTVGRLVEGKRVDLVIDAVAELRRRRETVRLDVVGDGPLLGVLRNQVARLALDGCVTFHGFVEDVARILGDADCFVLASETEGMPMVVLEAMALGVPVVATAVGSLPALSQGDRNIRLVTPGNRDQLVSALEGVLLNPTLAGALSRNAREKYERDHIPAVTAVQYHRIYETLCD